MKLSVVASLMFIARLFAQVTTLQAQEAVGPFEHVAYGDLNLTSAQGAHVFYARIRTAAQHVCAPLESRELTRRAPWQQCYRAAIADAVARVDSKRVTQLYNEASKINERG